MGKIQRYELQFQLSSPPQKTQVIYFGHKDGVNIQKSWWEKQFYSRSAAQKLVTVVMRKSVADFNAPNPADCEVGPDVLLLTDFSSAT